MRNLAAVQVLAGPSRAWAAVVVYADAAGLHAAHTDWEGFKKELTPAVRFDAVSYQALLDLFTKAVGAAGLPRGEWLALSAHVQKKIAAVVAQRATV
jgi:hypothetical protein